jgi:signal transduction histidine kinase
MTTGTPASHPVLPTGPAVRRLAHDLRAVPVRFLALACAAAVLVLLGARATPVDYYFGPDDSVQAFIGALWRLGHVLLVVAPLLALRWPLGATALALLPAPIILFGQHAWPFITFVSLVTVAMVSMWRNPVRALAPATVALLGIALLLSGSTVMVMPYGAEIGFDYGGGPDAGVRLLTFGIYLAAVLVALGIAWSMRSSVRTARRAATLEARSTAVEGQATVLGERARLARDLHDVVAHHVSLIAVRAETAPYTHPDLSPEARGLLDQIAADARRALDELRGVLGVLRRAEDGAPERAPQPQLAEIAELVEAAHAAGEDVSLSGALDVTVGSAQQYVAYRVVQEALTNARRHAPGQPVEIVVDAEKDAIRVRVTTPNPSASTSTQGAGHGLDGMRERVEALGGSLMTGVRDDLFVVDAELPRGAL